MFWVNLAVAVGTISAVFAALFGKVVQAKLFPPALVLKLTDGSGEATRRQMQDGAFEQVRYYHVRVTNSRRWSPANEVQIVLLQVEEPGPDRELRVTWRGEMPLAWKHGQLFPLQRTIGSPAVADLCSVGERAGLQLHLLVAPFNLEVVWQGASDFVLTLQGRANEAESPVLRIRISWDGVWHPGEAEMRSHMVVQPWTE